MDNELILQQFDEIEKRIERLMATCDSLETANASLKNRVSQLEAELQEKVDAEKRFSEQKSFVRSKIDGLLAKLENVSGL